MSLVRNKACMNSAASNPKTFPLSRVNGIVHVRLFKRNRTCKIKRERRFDKKKKKKRRVGEKRKKEDEEGKDTNRKKVFNIDFE